MDENTKTEIVQRLKAIISQVEPNAHLSEKYGGTIVECLPRQPETQFCGIFAYKSHVSLEFTKGAALSDPERFLEGSGTYRRHLKIASLSDISGKKCEDFLRQACPPRDRFL